MRKILLLAIFVTGCAYDPAFGDLTCQSEGAVREGQRCEGGVWVGTGEYADVGRDAHNPPGTDAGPTSDSGPGSDATVPDANVPDTTLPDTDVPDTDVPDTNVPDTNVPDTNVPDACVPESDLEFCDRLNAVCGARNAPDNCGDDRTVASCGSCGDNAVCTSNNVCECEAGFEPDGAACKPACEVDNPCDVNATCSGDRVCTCNDGYVGDGVVCDEIVAPSIVAIVGDDTGNGDLTTGNLAAQQGDLYLAFIGIDGSGRVDGVTGLDLTWTRGERQCSSNNTRFVEVWYARGTPGATNGPVEVDVTGSRDSSAVVVYQITDVSTSMRPANVETRNANNSGGCGSASGAGLYSYDVTRQDDNSLMLSALVSRGVHTPGSGWTEDEELQRLEFSISTSHLVPTTNPVTVSGAMILSHWVSVTVEVFGN